ncbi:MAG: hypothetical protein HY356_01335 [Gammaproteobacteria bacterium]|nr:hypothetical protein [Gammaproteobacteria bacterium]
MFIKKVIRALEQYHVRYALVGGYAVALHGATRGTVDIDIVITLNLKTFKNTEKAFKSIGLEPRLPVTADEVFGFREEYIKNRNLVAWSFVSPRNPMEMVDVVITENLKDIRTVNKAAFDMKIKVAAIDDLIMIKKKSNRKQDREDIKALEKLR